MSIDITAYLADIERQMAEWRVCGTCYAKAWPEPCNNPYCVNGRIPQPLYIVGEGVHSPMGLSRPQGSAAWLGPPAGWPSVGERVKCETCGGSGQVPNAQGSPSYFDSGPGKLCPACNGEGSTLPRVPLTVTCQRPTDHSLHDECNQGTVPWGSALWQTLPVVEFRTLTGPQIVFINADRVYLVNTGAHPDLERDEVKLDWPAWLASVRPGSFVAILTDLEMA